MSGLADTIKSLLAAGRGILAADESNQTANKRLNAAGVEPTEEHRRQYRELLLTTPGIEQYLSGVILYDETIRQAADDGTPFADLLKDKGIVPGIKTDQGLAPLIGSPNEQVSQGLEGLDGRNREYVQMGARFAKWRSVIRIGDGLPTEGAIAANAKVLAEYAKVSQDTGLVPIVEPEVLLEGDHTLQRCEEVLAKTLAAVFDTISAHGVDSSALLLKTSMALPGKDSNQRTNPPEVAEATVRALKASVPAEVGGIVFLSGGQSPAAATANLNAIAQTGDKPWFVTFSYSRALQDPVLEYWAGRGENVAHAQELFEQRCRLASLAARGKYSPDMEPDYSEAKVSGSQD